MKYYTTFAMLFVGLLLTANTIGPKPLQLGPVVLPAGLMLFPLTYLLGVILTEVYGFYASRRVIWTALACNLFMATACQLAVLWPGGDAWTSQEAYAQVLIPSSRIMVVSVFTYLIGEFINAYIVAKLKIFMAGKRFWVRAISGSAIGECVETALFLPLAFWDWPAEQLWRLAPVYITFKVGYAFCALPLVGKLAGWLKRVEGIDYYDTHTDFNPLAIFTEWFRNNGKT